MVELQESRWIDLSTPDDQRSERQRLVKTLNLPTMGIGRAVRIEVVTERSLGEPPEDALTEWLYEWLEETD